MLIPAGYNEEQWYAELKAEAEKQGKQNMIKEVSPYSVSLEKAELLSEEFKIPLHPSFIFYWSQISLEQASELLSWLSLARIDGKVILPFAKEKFEKAKRALELIGCEQIVTIENIVIPEIESKALFVNLGLTVENFFEKIKKIQEEVKNKEDTLELINSFSKHLVKDKAGSFIGARMGRPEKAKLRKLEGSPHVLFPVGEAGGRLRSVQEACESSVKADFPIYFCDNCKAETIYFICETCGKPTTKIYYCPDCERKLNSESCHTHGKIDDFTTRKIDIKHYLDSAVRKLNLQKVEMPALIKGVRGTSSRSHVPENLAKGILRAIFNLNVNKDGTIRYDATEIPITHFKPSEIGTSIDKLKELGYTHDVYNKELENSGQILELKPHDIILPVCPDSAEEKADYVFWNIANFIDNLLVRFYGLKPFYNLKTKEELAGHLVACIAPHNSAAVLGRIIGFSKIQALLASPFLHAAMRRDCDGDEAAVMLLMDMLLNFSREFLPSHRGGTQDAPLILNARLHAGEVDDMVFDIETTSNFPVEFYEAASQYKMPYSIKICQVRDKLNDGDEVFNNLDYTHETSDINQGVTYSAYKKLDKMQEKVQKQMELVEKIRAVDATDVASLVIQRHLIRDIKGNLRKFSMQQFRCVKCNEKFRRPPLQGNCTKCSGRIIFTISEGGIIKYLEPALQLAKKYEVPAYIRQSLELTQGYIESIFGKEAEKQEALEKWF
jgi:DNA polymerase II large subunit